MNLIYYSHSYRPEDEEITRYFGRLMRSEKFVINVDPPSESVNSAKLERHLNNNDGMVSVITRRKGGVSKHILFEISLCLRARKPLVVFVEDELPDTVIPSRVLQRRFSRRSYLRQIRQHRHALQILKAYLGDQPPPSYQPSTLRRSCLLIGTKDMTSLEEGTVTSAVRARGYNPLDLGSNIRSSPVDAALYETIARSSLAVCCLDSDTPGAQFLSGVIQSTIIPSINFSFRADYPFNPKVPVEYQPRILTRDDSASIRKMIKTEFELFEEDFVELGNQEEVETYTRLLVDLAPQDGNYDQLTRTIFVQELNMGTKYNISGGNQGAVGDNASASNFSQLAQQALGTVDLNSLAAELSSLRQAARSEATGTDHDAAVLEIGKAEEAAKAGDKGKVVEHLKSAGTWALDVATKIGSTVAAEVIKKSIGL